MLKEFEFHRASNLFPLDEENLDELAEDIHKHGQQVAIEIFDGKILDGRRRYLACQRAKVEPRVIEVDVDNPVTYVVSLNLHRRHLTISEKAMCAVDAVELEEELAREAKERQMAGGERGRHVQKGLSANLREPIADSGKTSEKMGKLFGVSSRTMESASAVKRGGTPNLQKAVKSGLIAVSTAAEVATLPEEEQEEKIEKVKQAKAEGKRYSVRREVRDKKRGELGSFKGAKGVGILYAYEAINHLKRIPKDDALRSDGFKLVTNWIRSNK